MTDLTDNILNQMHTDKTWWYGALALMAGFLIGLCMGLAIGSHKAPRTRRQPVEHCILVDTAPDYRDVQCPSGIWRYIGDTLRIRLHT